MPYRRTKKYSAERQRAAQATRAANRLAGPAPDYPRPIPHLRRVVVVIDFDAGEPRTHTFRLYRSRRVDQFRVTVDGQPWKVAGFAGVLEGLRKAMPRRLSDRAVA